MDGPGGRGRAAALWTLARLTWKGAGGPGGWRCVRYFPNRDRRPDEQMVELEEIMFLDL